MPRLPREDTPVYLSIRCNDFEVETLSKTCPTAFAVQEVVAAVSVCCVVVLYFKRIPKGQFSRHQPQVPPS